MESTIVETVTPVVLDPAVLAGVALVTLVFVSGVAARIAELLGR